MNKKYILIVLALLVLAIILLAGRLVLKQNSQKTAVSAPKTQQKNDNSQQGGPDLPGQPAGNEAGGGNN